MQLNFFKCVGFCVGQLPSQNRLFFLLLGFFIDIYGGLCTFRTCTAYRINNLPRSTYLKNLNSQNQLVRIKMNQIPKPSNDIMKNEQKQVNVTMDVLEQAEEKK